MTESILGGTAAPHPSEKPTFTMKVDATGGTYTLTIEVPGNATFTTAAIAFNASAATVRTAINTALDGIGMTCEASSGGPGDSGGTTPYVLDFTYPVGLTATSSLTGGGAAVTFTGATAGPPRIQANGTNLTLPATSLPDKIATMTPKVVSDRNYETTA